MNVQIADYDKALYFTLWGQWDDLLVLMVRTKDDFLAKKIESFLHAYHYSPHDNDVSDHHYSLLQYIDHAMYYEPPAEYTLV
ncbi:hypothetical protein N781_06630 [Pontibacillus halophilus JSM 076056 = DSM 19796]|uniref:YhdB-like protein n=1 Tax=Pontibacillus halophilus JSM 076056 = DSM 19796 TaxID=1385510 RepID=A0A0A5GC10_9BACI|nr:YhdB family protein [Pontibacillus halophilus]KGX90726.1 hypothetical protein N781_06630 [Pontibacillus halophilus JSM 076056 = DSM 19796]